MIVKIASELSLRVSQVEKAIELLEDGNRIPFIARYRKEMTGGLNEEQLHEIERMLRSFKDLEAYKERVLQTITQQGQLTPELEARITQAQGIREVEDLFFAFRGKKPSRAWLAHEQGLGPLAEMILSQNITQGSAEDYALQYVDPESDLLTTDAVLAGARDIVAEKIAEDAEIRDMVRKFMLQKGVLVSRARNYRIQSEFEMYYDFSDPIRRIPAHRVLAISRGERERILKVWIDVPKEEIYKRMEAHLIKNQSSVFLNELKLSIRESYDRLIAPSIQRQIREDLNRNAEEHAIRVFAKNLRSILLQPPVRDKVIMGVGSGTKTGSKLAVVDRNGKYVEGAIIDLSEDWEAAKQQVTEIINRHQVDVIAIGNGTTYDPTEKLIAEIISAFDGKLSYAIVDEAEAGVYSTSEAAQEEFPDLEPGLRGNIFIARRLQDPLSELVKIRPRFIRVGLYQQDVDQGLLEEELTFVMQSCVNQVGVNPNTASPFLLGYVCGISYELAKEIVRHREAKGQFKDREDLKQVKGLSQKEFLQCAGFLRIPESDNPLDNTFIHPESYGDVIQLLERWGNGLEDLNESVKALWVKIRLAGMDVSQLASELGLGEPTLRDILDNLKRPGYDPREEIPSPLLRTEMPQIEELKEGMVLKGIVKNVVDFGAFVDIGLKKNGLVHISQLSNKFVKDPSEIVSVGDLVDVKVIGVDAKRGRIALSMRL